MHIFIEIIARQLQSGHTDNQLSTHIRILFAMNESTKVNAKTSLIIFFSNQGKPRRQRTISMEDYDKPNIRRLSVTSKE